MDLNFSPEVIVEFAAGIVLLIIVLFSYGSSKTKKIVPLFYIKISFLIASIHFFLSALSIMFMNILLNELSAIITFIATIFFIIGINYSMKDSFFSISLIPVFCLGTLLCYLTIQFDMVQPSISGGYQIFNWTNLFGIIGYLIGYIWVIYFFYWGLYTWLNAPFLIKKEASIAFFGSNIPMWLPVIISSFELVFPQYYLWYIIISDIFFVIALLFFLLSLIREPKLLYILPFNISRILVKDKEGYPLFDHDWSESDISDLTFTGFINAVQLMSEEVMNYGGLVDINLEKGILILCESELITVGIIASRSSKMLREILTNFTSDFEQQFERDLKKSNRDMSTYEAAYLLIDKYFSNFPFKKIPNKQHPISLTGKYAQIPLELDNKLKVIFTEDIDYEFVKSEVIKSPLSVSEVFFALYDDLKEERERLLKKDTEELGYSKK